MSDIKIETADEFMRIADLYARFQFAAAQVTGRLSSSTNDPLNNLVKKIERNHACASGVTEKIYEITLPVVKELLNARSSQSSSIAPKTFSHLPLKGPRIDL